MPLHFCEGLQWTVTDLVWDRSGTGYEERHSALEPTLMRAVGHALWTTHTHIYTHTAPGWPRAVNYTTVFWSRKRGSVRENGAREKTRETDRKSERKSSRQWVLWVIMDSRRVWHRNDGPWKTPWCFPLCTHGLSWSTYSTINLPSPLLAPLSFILHFPAKRVCPLNSPLFADTLCCTSSDLWVLLQQLYQLRR